MKNYRVRYTRPTGAERTTASAFDRPSAEEYADELIEEGYEDVEIIEVKPGE